MLAALTASGAPTGAATLHATMRAGGSGIGLSTVYRELQALVDRGTVHAFSTGTETWYRLPVGDLLVCDGCGATRRVASIVESERRLAGFFSPATPLTVHGRCRSCRATTPGTATT